MRQSKEHREHRLAKSTPKRLVLQLSLQYYCRHTVAASQSHYSKAVSGATSPTRPFDFTVFYLFFDAYTQAIVTVHIKSLDTRITRKQTSFLTFKSCDRSINPHHWRKL